MECKDPLVDLGHESGLSAGHIVLVEHTLLSSLVKRLDSSLELILEGIHIGSRKCTASVGDLRSNSGTNRTVADSFPLAHSNLLFC